MTLDIKHDDSTAIKHNAGKSKAIVVMCMDVGSENNNTRANEVIRQIEHLNTMVTILKQLGEPLIREAQARTMSTNTGSHQRSDPPVVQSRRAFVRLAKRKERDERRSIKRQTQRNDYLAYTKRKHYNYR